MKKNIKTKATGNKAVIKTTNKLEKNKSGYNPTGKGKKGETRQQAHYGRKA